MKRRIIGCSAIVCILSAVGCSDTAPPVTNEQQVVTEQEKKADSIPPMHDTLSVNEKVVEKPVEEKQKLGTVAKDEKKEEVKAVQPEAEMVSDVQKGKELIAGADCMACHKLNERVIGPSYKEVAQKYAAGPETVQRLADKIIAGGAGNWGQVSMTPHATLPVADARKMVTYILSLK